MWDRRPVLLALIGLSLCVSIWRISSQEPHIITEYMNIINENTNTNDTITYPSPILLDELPPDDFTTLIDLTDFAFLMNQPACGEKNSQQPATLVLIHSAPRNWNKRNTIRQTWGQKDRRSRIIFLLGYVDSLKLQRRLEYENHLYEDMVQGNFVDAYRNMTYKHVMALKWFTYYCPRAKYLLKTDDDVFVHSQNVYDYLDSSAVERRNLLFCSKLYNARVSRSYRSKWRVSTKEYSNRFYPTYCPGFSIIYSSDIVFRLYKEGQKRPYFWIDDVHITGTLAKATNVTITPLGDTYLTLSQRRSLVRGYVNATAAIFLFTSPNLTEDEIRLLWKLISPLSSSSMSSLSSSSSANVIAPFATHSATAQTSTIVSR